MAAVVDVLAALTWSPGVRGVLVVGVGVLVLMGSVYLILATNSGARLGFLLSLTALMGWMTIMGFVWSVYGIGRQGDPATWKVLETSTDLNQTGIEVARDLPVPADLPTPESLLEADPALAEQFPEGPGLKRPNLGDLLGVKPDLADTVAQDLPEGWDLLATSDPQTGEALASASNYLTEVSNKFESTDDFIALESFSRGGKDKLKDDANLLDRASFKVQRVVTWPLGHPVHYGVVQVQRVVEQETVPGQAPPLPVADEEQPVLSVIMERDLGTKRLPSVILTIFSAVVFGICCNSLHRRDKLVTEARSAATALART
ncbi:MAG: hypothetical protein WKF43_07015 [Acidimicrobiales bacterium]